MYISASNPANNPNSGPAIVSAHLEGDKVEVEPLLLGTADAIDIPTDASIQLNLQDPDSMTRAITGRIVRTAVTSPSLSLSYRWRVRDNLNAV